MTVPSRRATLGMRSAPSVAMMAESARNICTSAVDAPTARIATATTTPTTANTNAGAPRDGSAVPTLAMAESYRRPARRTAVPVQKTSRSPSVRDHAEDSLGSGVIVSAIGRTANRMPFIGSRRYPGPGKQLGRRATLSRRGPPRDRRPPRAGAERACARAPGSRPALRGLTKHRFAQAAARPQPDDHQPRWEPAGRDTDRGPSM